MADSSKTPIKTFSGDGFSLLPWGEFARDGSMAKWQDFEISIVIVLLSFENKNTGEAFPSLDTIAALAGMSKTTVAKAVEAMEGHWFKVIQRQIGRGRSKNVYQLTYKRYDYGIYGDSAGWIKVHHDLVKNGMWAIMPPSVRKLYLIMKAFCMPGSYANVGWLNREYDGGSWYDYAEDFDFMPASVFDAFGKERPALSELCGIQGKTYRDARAWLLCNGLMQNYEGDYCHGLAFPYDVGKYVPKVLGAIQEKRKMKEEHSRKGCTGGAKKSMRAIKVLTMKVKSGEIPGDPRVKKTPVKAADSVLYSMQ